MKNLREKDTPEYRAWLSMRHRCEKNYIASFVNYGGRGISVCERWRSSYKNFLADMGRRPSSSHSLDRINNNGPYSPKNCRWATREQQGRNKRTNHLVTLQGKTQPLGTWAKELKIPVNRLRWRLEQGWPEEKVMSSNRFYGHTMTRTARGILHSPHASYLTISFQGKTQSLRVWAKELHLPYQRLAERLRRGWSVEQVFSLVAFAKRPGFPNVQGDANKNSRLTSKQVKEIRKLIAEGLPCSIIAAKFSISRSNLSAIKLRQTWKHI